MGKTSELQLLLDKYIDDVSKHKLQASQRAIVGTKTMSYVQFVAVMQQFLPNISCLSVENCKYIKMLSNDLNKHEYITYSTYKEYPITIRQLVDKTEIVAVCMRQLVDALVCVSGEPLFVPIMAERVLYERRLHQMTLVFDTKRNYVFLHDPNGKSLFNDNITYILLHSYVGLVNAVLEEYGMKRFEYISHDFPYVNIRLCRLWMTILKGNCVVASIVFIILFQNIQDLPYITKVLHMSTRKEYDHIYTAFYNKIEYLLGLLT